MQFVNMLVEIKTTLRQHDMKQRSACDVRPTHVGAGMEKGYWATTRLVVWFFSCDPFEW